MALLCLATVERQSGRPLKSSGWPFRLGYQTEWIRPDPPVTEVPFPAYSGATSRAWPPRRPGCLPPTRVG